MSNTERNDPIWQTAWGWVTREHEQPLNSGARSELLQWLQSDPAHRTAYEEASRLWLLVGLVPPANDLSQDVSPDESGSDT